MNKTGSDIALVCLNLFIDHQKAQYASNNNNRISRDIAILLKIDFFFHIRASFSMLKCKASEGYNF